MQSKNLKRYLIYRLVPTKIFDVPTTLDYNVMNEKYLFGN